jgi:hypothetical protein
VPSEMPKGQTTHFHNGLTRAPELFLLINEISRRINTGRTPGFQDKRIELRNHKSTRIDERIVL